MSHSVMDRSGSIIDAIIEAQLSPSVAGFDLVRAGLFRRGRLFPKMTWWEWVWYIVVVMASASAFQHMLDWMDDWLSPIPVLGWWPALISWPVLGGLFALVAHFGLPAREARKAAPGEAFLSIGLWIVASLVESWITGQPARWW